jgi:hypothetical protein
MKTFSTRTTIALSLAAATGLVLCGLSQPAQAGDPGGACERSKLKAQGKFSACLKKADATAVKKGIAADYDKCEGKIEEAYTKAEAKADGECPSQDDLDKVIQILHEASADTSTGTAGGTYVFCGDVIVEGTESCDGSALGGETCEGLGFASGLLACTPGCGFDVSGCVSNPPDTCGDSVIDGNESCDGSALGGETCEGLGFASGALGCTAGCGFDVSGCVSNPPDTCGDSLIDGNESCDGTALGGQTCESLGFASGALGCTAGCGFDVSGCVAGGGGGLPATGQTTAYGPGSDGAIQAGCAQSFTDNGDGTITDNCTGLMWEKKDDSGGLHDKDNLYTWSGASAGSTNVMDGTIQDFIDELNGLAPGQSQPGDCFAGYCDWRAPNRNELVTLVDIETFDPSINTAFNYECGQPCVQSGGLSFGCSCTASAGYWSSSTDQPFGAAAAWFVSFFNGGASSDFKDFDRQVRAVRGGL